MVERFFGTGKNTSDSNGEFPVRRSTVPGANCAFRRRLQGCVVAAPVHGAC